MWAQLTWRRAQLTWRTLLSLFLGPLLLSVAAMGGCSNTYHELLRQLQRQADLMQDPSRLLEHYIEIQGLNTPVLQAHCKEQPRAFPSEDALRGLSKQSFLQTLDSRLGHVLHRLAALQPGLPTAEVLGPAMMDIRGFRNNIYCLAQLLPDASKTPRPTQAALGTSPLATPASGAFQRKLEDCRLLRGYHRFMHSVGQVFRGWGLSPGRSRRHSLHPALWKGVVRVRPSRKHQRLVARVQLPR